VIKITISVCNRLQTVTYEGKRVKTGFAFSENSYLHYQRQGAAGDLNNNFLKLKN